jgi:hypothetical protein
MRYNSVVTEEQELELVKLYIQGAKISELIEKYGWKKGSRSSVIKILRNHNVDIRQDQFTHSTKYTLNKFYFSKIDSKDKAYFLGLLYADGSITKDHREMKLSLQEKDKYINSNKPLRLTKKRSENHQNQYTFVLETKNIINDLVKQGVTPYKLYDIQFPNNKIVEEKFIPHFIRGYFDGDGSVSVSHTCRKLANGNIAKYPTQMFNFSGHINMCKSLKEIINPIINSKTFTISKRYKNSDAFHGHQIGWGGKLMCAKFYNYLYKDCDDLFLIRKKEKFEEIINSPVQ